MILIQAFYLWKNQWPSNNNISILHCWPPWPIAVTRVLHENRNYYFNPIYYLLLWIITMHWEETTLWCNLWTKNDEWYCSLFLLWYSHYARSIEIVRIVAASPYKTQLLLLSQSFITFQNKLHFLVLILINILKSIFVIAVSLFGLLSDMVIPTTFKFLECDATFSSPNRKKKQ